VRWWIGVDSDNERGDLVFVCVRVCVLEVGCWRLKVVWDLLVPFILFAISDSVPSFEMCGVA